MEKWLLFLGAGASVARPTRLPLFYPLADGVLRAMGCGLSDTARLRFYSTAGAFSTSRAEAIRPCRSALRAHSWVS